MSQGGAPPRRADEQDILSKSLRVESKNFYFDLKQNRLGRFVKLAEVTRGGRNAVILPESGWIAIRDMLNGFITGEHLEKAGVPVPPIPSGMAVPRRPRREEASSGYQIWVENLPWETSEEDLQHLFAPCGSLESVEVNRDRQGRSRGTATLRFSNAAEANDAIQRMNDVEIGDRKVHVRLDRFG